MAGTTAAAAMMTALERRRTGEGTFLDLSQHEVGVEFLGEYFVARQIERVEPDRIGNAHPTHAPHGVYRCAGDDESIALAARDDTEWAALSAEVGAGWERDPASPQSRTGARIGPSSTRPSRAGRRTSRSARS